MRIGIRDIAYYLPERIVTNDELHQENPSWDMERIEGRAGVVQRHIARDDETALDLALRACEQLFSRNEGLSREIDGVLFCTQSPDHILPGNSSILHKELELSENVLALDFTLACSGFVYGLTLAQSLIQSNHASQILLVTADTYSKYIHEKDRSVRVLFGDAAAVSWISASESEGGIIDTRCSTFGRGYDKFIVPAGGCRQPKSRETSLPIADENGNVHTLEHIHMDGMRILAFVNSRVPKQVRELLEKNKLTLQDVDLFIFQQASKTSLDSLERLLKIPPEKNFRNITNLGNTVSPSIPIAIKDATDQGRLSSGDKVLISGFGVGFSLGSAILDY